MTYYNVCLPNIVLRSMLVDKHNWINMCHINACSIFPKIAYLRQVVKNTNLNVICISETWLNKTHTNQMVNIPGFNLVRHDRSRSDRARGGGVAIYIKLDLGFSIKYKSVTGCPLEFLFVEVNTSNNSLLVGCVYNPPDALRNFMPLCNVLIQSNSEHILVAGDFNLNLLRENVDTANLVDQLCDSGSIIINHEPTHYMPNSTPSCIDLFITNNPDRVIMNDQVEVPGISHHDLIVLTYGLPMVIPASTPQYFRDYKNVNERDLIMDLLTLPWDSIYDFSSPDDQIRIFNRLTLELLDKHIPLKMVK